MKSDPATKSDWKKLAYTYAVGILVGAYKAFVLMLMWNWFVSPVFHTESISFWQVLGLLWLVQLFVGDTGENPAQTLRWESLFLIVNASVPEDRNEDLQEELRQQTEGVWLQMGLHIFGQLAGYTVTLALGWLVHTVFVAA
jgi:hypothetical protein